MSARLVAIVTCIAFLLEVSRGVAAPDPTAEARRLYDQATEAYKIGHFEEALVGYEEAYKLFKSPAFLFNIGQCQLRLKHWDRAEFFFEGYLRDVPDAPNRALVEDLIREARDQAATERDAAQRKAAREQQDLEDRRKQAEAEERVRLATQVRPETPERPIYKKWWFWGAIGAAAAGVAITVAATSGGTRTELPEGSLGTWDKR